MNISSFGEDEAGELYVVGLGGSVSQIVASASCSYSISPASQAIAAGGGTGGATVTVSAGCAWSATSNATWIHVASGAAGNGNGSVSFSVDANTGNSRSGTLTIAGKTFTVTQGGTVGCKYSISPKSARYHHAGGTGTVTVTAEGSCAWTATSSVDWITITSGRGGKGRGTVMYSVGPYTGSANSRTGTLTIGGQTFTVTQAK
jgi:hypothetical protein